MFMIQQYTTQQQKSQEQSEDQPARLSSHKEAPDIPGSNNIDKIINILKKQIATGKWDNC